MSTEDIWLYFEAVLVPAIEQWQASCHDADTSTIGNLLDAALSKSKHSNEQMSKVIV
ncbi:hypothetical protein SPONL_1541 [uncultured Candidatus Thioglobus sp.]|nr:hypothetical protein SPONL_1541 [uncultured Candidatus Thioglobus sp.]